MFLLLLFLFQSVQSHPDLCSSNSVLTLRGHNVFDQNAVTVAVFSPLQCANCYNYLTRLNQIAALYSHVRFHVVAPDFESNYVISKTQNAFTHLILDKSQEGWRRFGAKNFDVFIIDRCGRLSQIIGFPHSDVTKHTTLETSVAAAQSHARCGFCQYETRSRKPDPKNVHVYLKEQEARNRERSRHIYSTNQAQSEIQYQRNVYQQQNSASYQKSTTTTTQTPKVVLEKPKVDYDYYDGLDDAATTQKPKTQIPTPPLPLPNWPTPPPNGFFYPPNFGVNQSLNFANTPLVSENNVPCSAYTDDICFQQRERLGFSQMSRCCSKGVYLTDVCVPGKCSNSTTQVCCFQKFLQAKYSCCQDPGQDDTGASTNKFNKCCYDNFLTEDDLCCPKESAQLHWKSVYELCYPNTQVNFTAVKFEVHFAEGVRVLDLSSNRQWEFECKHGRKRIQLAYLP